MVLCQIKGGGASFWRCRYMMRWVDLQRRMKRCCPVWHSWYTNVIDCPSFLTKYSYFTFKRLKVKVIFDVAIFIKHHIYIDGHSKKVRQAQIGYLQCYFYSTLLLTKKYTNNIRYCKDTFPFFLPKYRNTHRLYHLLLWAAVTNL